MSEDVLEVEEGSLYPALQRLLIQGWVSAEWGQSENNRRARYYQLTAAGRKQLERELSEFNRVIRAGTRPSTNITIETPLIHLSKRDIVKRGVELRAPFDLTWSCYRDSDAACGVCDSCALRLRAFQQSGVEDPIAYASKPEYART